MVNWWFGLVISDSSGPPCNNLFQKRIPGIQTTNPNHQFYPIFHWLSKGAVVALVNLVVGSSIVFGPTSYKKILSIKWVFCAMTSLKYTARLTDLDSLRLSLDTLNCHFNKVLSFEALPTIGCLCFLSRFNLC